MKRLGSSDSLSGLMSMCPPSDEYNTRNNIHTKEYQSTIDGLDEETDHVTEKKRRLSVIQVKALERNFEVENKLEPEKKVKLAQQLGLQPRQVAVWFQNRRARSKTKQLERDYDVLKSNFDSLKHNFDSLQHDNDALLQEIKELKSKLNEEKNTECIKEEALIFESESNDTKAFEPVTPPESLSHGSEDPKPSKLNNVVLVEIKDGPSKSDSSTILNDNKKSTTQYNPIGMETEEDRIYAVFPLLLANRETVSDNNDCPHASNLSSGAIFQQDLLTSPNGNSISSRFSCSSSSSPPSINCLGFLDSRSNELGSSGPNNSNVHNSQFVKIEEHDFFNEEDQCNFFSEEQAPSLYWYCPN